MDGDPIERRAGTHPPSLASIAALALAGAATFALSSCASPEPVDRVSTTPRASPTQPFPMSVFLCQEDDVFQSCDRRRSARAATRGEIAAIERVLTGMRQVESVVFEDRQEAYENFRLFADKTLLNVLTVEDMPRSFQIQLRPGADRAGVTKKLSGLPGVSNVMDGECVRNALDPEFQRRHCR